MVDRPDFVLIHRAQRGDEAAFTQLVERHQQRVYSLLYGMLGNPHDTQDALQETFLAAYRGLKSFRSDAKFTTWIHRIALNKAHDLMRKNSPTPLDPQEELGAVIDRDAARAVDDFQQADSRAILQAGITQLDTGFREAFVLMDVLQAPIAETAEVLEVSVGTVKSRVFRARREMAEFLREAGFAPASGTIPSPSPSDTQGSQAQSSKNSIQEGTGE